MAPDPKILILEQSRNEATRTIESGLVKPRGGESKTKAINRISEEIFFKKLQEYSAKQNPITNTNDDFDDLTITPDNNFNGTKVIMLPDL